MYLDKGGSSFNLQFSKSLSSQISDMLICSFIFFISTYLLITYICKCQHFKKSKLLESVLSKASLLVC